MLKDKIISYCPNVDYPKIYIGLTAIILLGLYTNKFKKYNLVVFMVACGLFILTHTVTFDMKVDLMKTDGPKCPTKLILNMMKEKNKKNKKNENKERFKVQIWDEYNYY